MAESIPVFNSAFTSWQDGHNGLGRRPVIFDILAADKRTSILPDDLLMVLHVNPNSMKLNYQKNIVRTQTRGGWVEFHWGDAVESITFDMATGGFMRLTSGLSNKTGTGLLEGEQARKGRRETIAYDKYLDFLALYKNGGAVFDSRGNIASQGYIKITFDEGVYIGWFDNLSVTESVEKPFQFTLTSSFIISEEIMVWRSTLSSSADEGLGIGPLPQLSEEAIFEGFTLPEGVQ